MYLNYFDSAEGITIDQNRALIEVLNHGADIWEFLTDMGDRKEYEAQDVLLWLGY